MMTRSIIILFLLVAYASANASCEDFWSSEDLKSYIALLEKVRAARPAWRNFKITDHAIIIANAKTEPQCASVYFNGTTVSNMTLSSGILQLASVDIEAMTKQLPKELNDDQRKAVIEQIKAHFSQPADWHQIGPNVPNANVPDTDFKPILDRLGQYSAIAVSLHQFASKATYLLNVVAHEGFHSFYQGSERSLQDRAKYKWPDWAINLADVSSTVAECYSPNNEVATAHKIEKATLLSAVKAANSGDRAAALDLTRKFFEIRRQRYNLVEEHAVKTRDLRSTMTGGCRSAEAGLELTEGSANFVGLESIIRAGLVHEADAVSFVEDQNTSTESWYGTGTLQIILAKALLNEPDFSKLLERLENSVDSAHALTYEIEKIVADSI
jgi:hypothetical protein